MDIKAPIEASTRDRSFYMDQISKEIANKKEGLKKRSNVNKDISNNVNNVEDELDKLLGKIIEISGDKPESIGQTIAEKLNDVGNVNFHIKTARLNQPQILFEALALTLDAYKQGLIRTSRAKYYVGVLKRKKVIWK